MVKNGTYDAVVIGSGLGSLTAAALLSRAGKRVAVVERNSSLGGAASCYRTGQLTIEASLHETADPHDPRDLKHAILDQLGLLDKIDWVPIANLHTVIGGPVGEPLELGHGFEAIGDQLSARFPEQADGVRRLLDRMNRIYTMVGSLNAAGEARSLSKLVFASKDSWPLVRDWRFSLDEAFLRDLGDCEGAKCALAANLAYYADDPRKTWWLYFAVAQGGYFGSGGVFIRGGSTRLSRALAKVVKQSGGDVFLGRRATDIDINETGRPVGVHHASPNGEAADRLATQSVLAGCAPSKLAELLPEAKRENFLAPYRGLTLSISLFCAHFGMKEQPANFGLSGYSTILLPDWMTSLTDYASAAALLAEAPAGRLPPLTVVNYGAVDNGLDDGGRILVTVAGVDHIENWNGLSKDEERARRAAWLDTILAELDRCYPGFAGATEERIFVTARSTRDYLATPGGAIYGFAPEPPTRSILAGIPRSPRTPIPGLFLASSFGGSGGFSGAMGAGAKAARLAL